mgnify:CR=1 FL=1
MFPVLRTADLIQFTMLGPHVIPRIMAPFPLVGKGTILKDYMPVCVLGDELPSALRTPMMYTQANFTIPGMGKIVHPPPPSHLSKSLFDNFRPVLLMGPPVQAQFIINAPATDPSTGVPDPVATKPLLVTYISTMPNLISG